MEAGGGKKVSDCVSGRSSAYIHEVMVTFVGRSIHTTKADTIIGAEISPYVVNERTSITIIQLL